MKLLALESSCDETSAAVIEDGYIVSNIISSQIELHAQYGGVVPELATREHLRNVPIVVREALNKASIKPSDLDCVAATRGPGLPGALMTGLRAGQSMARALKIPFTGRQGVVDGYKFVIYFLQLICALNVHANIVYDSGVC